MPGAEMELLLPDREVHCCKKRGLSFLSFIYGVVVWSPSREVRVVHRIKERFRRKGCWGISAALVFVLTICGAVTLTYYLFCYLPREDHVLRFLSYLCYWLAITSVPTICAVAMLMNTNENSTSFSWRKTLNKPDFLARMQRLNDSKKSSKLMFLLCLMMPAPHFILKLIMAIRMQKECQAISVYLGLSADSIGGFYFSFFWYFLSLQRIALDGAKQLTLEKINGAKDSYNHSVGQISEFFQQYYPVRNFMMGYSYALVFSSLIGLGVVFTWNYGERNVVALVTETPLVNASLREGICPYNCDTASFIHKNHMLTVYNVWVIWRHLMIAFIPVSASKGMDIKFIWDDFKRGLCLKYTQDNREHLKHVIKFAEEIHPKTTFTTALNFLMLVVTLATWMLSDQKRNF